MNDEEKAILACEAAQAEGREIDDATARVIASLYHNGQASLGYSFASTGAIPEDTSDLWRDLFGDVYNESWMGPKQRLMADMLGTYLINRADKGPVDGWSKIWL